ncbi:MAG TPA: DUF72 domain-containing protein [Bryobacteraceae bacterium]|nr:DUF72 domain-containing protein [Bryobacteraceae bacterium]
MKARGGCDVRIGCSGWHYKHWKGTFYPAGFPASKMLAFYMERFDTVELNNTFYRLPPEPAVHAWRDSTPPDFLFAVKGSRFLSHMKKFKDPELALERFFARADLLENKMGPILFQTPPFWEVDLDRLAAFLHALPPGNRYTFEFRHPSWHSPDVYELLRRYNAAFCAFDLAGFQSPIEVTADFTYTRLHGPGGPYQGSYSGEALALWAQRIAEWRKTLRAVYLYFDNDMEGYAAHNALELKRLVAQV